MAPVETSTSSTTTPGTRAMMQHEQTYAPMLAALENALTGLPRDSQSRHRLAMMREFPVFVESEMDGMAARWAKHRRKVERELTRS
ncbi:hypothetical protein [Nocardioides sp. B-3]|uniref:hypothetical protein n=1 Tax=Nocardioides sp. B-3 TaxID=2895565 RepID=UPI00215343ED|nr:hypothetical protein [Nocardioides sp. B-3]UUZ61911.1 hypothetical protein LP418_25485 [Nocardioides sp. B-3]